MKQPRPALDIKWPLILAGAAATAVVAFGTSLAGKPSPGLPAMVLLLLAVYAAGLGLGALLFGRG